MTPELLPSVSAHWRNRTDRAMRPILPARPAVPVPAVLRTPLARQAASFAAIGIASTLAYVALYAAIRNVATAEISNAAALLLTAVGNTAANRRLTFAVQGRDGLARDHRAGLLAFAIALAITSASLTALQLFARKPGRGLELAVLVTSNVVATVIRFVLLRLALNRREPVLERPPAHPAHAAAIRERTAP